MDVNRIICMSACAELTSALAATSEAVGFFAVAEPVDEGSQLPHVPNPPCHHHLLVDDVGLRKVCSSLWERNQLLIHLHTCATNESPCPSAGEVLQTGMKWEHAVLAPLTHPFLSNEAALQGTAAVNMVTHLDIDQQLPQIPRRHDHGCVQLDDVALVQCNVMICCEALEYQRSKHESY